MFFFPIGTDRRQRATPYLNYALIAANVLIFLLTRQQIAEASQAMALRVSGPALMEQFPVLNYYLWPESPRLVQFITYQFLHADWMHLLGNMIFLYVFGNALEDRLGRVGYLAFYLAGGIFAGLGHGLTSDMPVLGASGSIAAVTGAYLALFPMVNVTIFYWFYFYVGTFEISSLVLICFQIAQNFLLQIISPGSGVAYVAHLGGYAFGFVIGMGMLAVRLLPREPYDLLAMLAHRRRRTQFRAMTRQGYRPWEAHRPGDPQRGEAPRISAEDQRIMDVRTRIHQAMNDHDMDRAADHYARLLELDSQQLLSQQSQLDIANHLMSQARYGLAAQAYERFLAGYRAYPQREQIELILGLIYARYLGKPGRARELLAAALPRLHEPDQRALAEEVLDAVG